MIYRRTRRTVSPPTSGEDSLKFIPLGGFEEVGRNMMFFEHKNEIVIIDAGLQFPEETTPGIDYIIPNISYLAEHKEKIRGLIITHGHYDHIGAIPYIINKIGNPPIYAAAITAEIIKKRQEDFPNLPKLDIATVKHGDKIKLGESFDVEFFDLDHTIPDTLGVILKTPFGNMVHFVDFKFDYDHDGNPIGLDDYERIGKIGVHTLFMDSTNAEREGISISERLVEKNLEELFRNSQGRIIVGTFGSLITRLGEIIKIGSKIGRKVFVSGYSMKTNLQIAQNLGYLKFEKGTIIPIEELSKYKDEKIMILCTGAQGEPNASLMRIANGEHKFVKTKSGDTIILSSSIIAGNEHAVQVLKDNLTRQGARVYQSMHVDIHSSGHAPKEELKKVLQLVKPKFLVPVHGYYFMRAANRENAVDVGLPRENVFLMDNGQVAELTDKNFKISNKTVDAFYVMVDGLGVGDVGEVVLRDRRILSEEGMIVIIATLDKEKGHLLKNPDIISRGFIYLKENQEMLNQVRGKIKTIIGQIPKEQQIEAEYLKSLFRDQIGQLIYRKTQRRPMVLPVVIEV
jgi:ribonuclease J